MKIDGKQYKKLPGRKGEAFGVVEAESYSLWMGDEHLLSIVNSRFTESYKWFAYSNIQAFIVNRTRSGTTLNIVFSAISFFWLVLILMSHVFAWGIGFDIFLGIMVCLFVILLLMNLAAGPTCSTFIQTSVQKEQLKSLSRIKHMRRALKLLRERIQSEQGQLSDETIRMFAGSTEPAVDVLDHKRPLEKLESPVAKWGFSVKSKLYNSQAHLVLFTLLLADVCHSCVRWFVGNVFMDVLSLVLMVLMVTAAVWAVIKQHGTNLSDGIKVVVWISLCYMGIIGYVSNISSVFIHAVNGTAQLGSWQRLVEGASILPADSMYLRVMLTISIIMSGFLGFTGMFLLRKWENNRYKPPQLRISEPSVKAQGE